MDSAAPARSFVLKLGRALHAYGYPAHRLEDALGLVARRLGLEGQFFSTPTALFVSFNVDNEQKTFLLRVEPGETDLDKLARVDAVAGEVARGVLAPAAGAAQLDALRAAPPPYGRALTTLSFALASGSAARFFGGGWREIALSAVIGLVIGLLALLAGRFPGAGRVFEPVAAMISALLATVAAREAGSLSAYVTMLSGLIVLVPGFPLTVAMTELATRNLVSGTARLVATAGTFLAIGFGVALGTGLGQRLVGRPPLRLPIGLPEWTLWLALLIAPLAFCVLLKAAPRDAPWIVASGALAFGGARFGAQLLGPELGALGGALVVGLAANAYSRLLDRPAAVTLVPGILLLVPGSIGFQSLSSLLGRETLLGVEAAFRMTLVAVSLVTGLLFAGVLLPERKLSRDEPLAARRATGTE
jgi:uncharacterized membrane protein YjjP (DUF1212 family)